MTRREHSLAFSRKLRYNTKTCCPDTNKPKKFDRKKENYDPKKDSDLSGP